MSSENTLSLSLAANSTTTVPFEGHEDLLVKLTKVAVEGEVKGETKLLLLAKKDGEAVDPVELAVLNEETKEKEIESTFCGNCSAELKVEGESALVVSGEYVAKEEKKEEEAAPAEEEKKEEEAAPAEEEKKEEEAAPAEEEKKEE